MNKPSDQNLLISKVKKTIDSNCLLEPDDRILIGVSGGPDSMCLLHVFQTLSTQRCYSIAVAHIDHSLRGEASKSDQAFVSDYCKKNGIEFHTCTIDVSVFSKEHSIGIEEAARYVRYRYFQELTENHSMKIAVAHHQQDQVETIFLNLIRGCGLDGFKGMDYQAGNVIRPLLDCTKEEIESYLSNYRIPFRIDQTNAESCVDRNRVRLDLIPCFKKLFGRDISPAILNTRALCLQDADYLDNVSKQAYQSLSIRDALPCDASTDLSPAILSRVVRELFEKVKGDKKNLSFRQTESIIRMFKKRKEGAVVYLSDGLCATIHHHELHIMNQLEFKRHQRQNADAVEKGKSIRIPLIIPAERVEKEIKMFICTKFVEKPQEVDYNAMEWCFPTETIKDAVWRYRKEEDWIRPNRNSGKKTIRKFFIDEKIPRDKRDSLLFLAKGSEILWIPELGEKQAETDAVPERGVTVPVDGGFMEFVSIKLEHRS